MKTWMDRLEADSGAIELQPCFHEQSDGCTHTIVDMCGDSYVPLTPRELLALRDRIDARLEELEAPK